MVEPSHVVGLPKGQCFALMQGGQLWKIRMPLPAPDADELMPQDLQQLAGYMRQNYTDATQWWELAMSGNSRSRYCYAQRWSYTPLPHARAPRFCPWWPHGRSR